MSPADRWKHVAHILEARDVAVDLDVVTSDPDWAAQAEAKHRSRAADFVEVFDFLLADATHRATDPEPAADDTASAPAEPYSDTLPHLVGFQSSPTERGLSLPGTMWVVSPSGNAEHPWRAQHRLLGAWTAPTFEGALRLMLDASRLHPGRRDEWFASRDAIGKLEAARRGSS